MESGLYPSYGTTGCYHRTDFRTAWTDLLIASSLCCCHQHQHAHGTVILRKRRQNLDLALVRARMRSLRLTRPDSVACQ